MSEYRIVANSSADEVSAEVAAMMADGWEPLGGVSCSTSIETYEVYGKGYSETSLNAWYAQAMVRAARAKGQR